MKLAIVLILQTLHAATVPAPIPRPVPLPIPDAGRFSALDTVDFAQGAVAAGLLRAHADAFADDLTAAGGATEALARFRDLRRRVMKATDDARFADELFLAVGFTTDRSGGSARRRAGLRTRALERVVEDHRPLTEPAGSAIDFAGGDVVAGFVRRGPREIATYLRHLAEAARIAARGEADSRDRVGRDAPARLPDAAGFGLPSLLFPFSQVAASVRALAAPVVMIPLYEAYHRVREFPDWVRQLAELVKVPSRRRWAHLHFGTLASAEFVGQAVHGDLVAAGREHHRVNFDAMVGAERGARRELHDLIVDVEAHDDAGTLVLAEVVRYATARPTAAPIPPPADPPIEDPLPELAALAPPVRARPAPVPAVDHPCEGFLTR